VGFQPNDPGDRHASDGPGIQIPAAAPLLYLCVALAVACLGYADPSLTAPENVRNAVEETNPSYGKIRQESFELTVKAATIRTKNRSEAGPTEA